MSDQIESLKPEEVSNGERPLSLPSELPILPLRDTVLFPNSFMPLAVARESSVRLIDDAIANGKLIAVFTQRDASMEEPGQDDLYTVGTAAIVHRLSRLPEDGLALFVQGVQRVRLGHVTQTEPYLRADGVFRLALASVAPLGAHQVALALVTWVGPEEELLSGAAIVRVHDVKQMVRVARMADAIRGT